MRRFAPWIISLTLVSLVVSKMVPQKPASGFDVAGFGRLPLLVDGRVMPMDSLARISLSIMQGRQTYETAEGKKAPAIRWLMETLMAPERADNLKIFLVINPDVLGLFGWSNRKDKYFTLNELRASSDEIRRQSELAEQAEPQIRSAFQRQIIKLKDALMLYLRLKNSLQVEGSSDFGKEVAAFDRVILPGMQAIRDRDAGREFDSRAFDSILLFTQRYQNVCQARYVYAFPNPAVPGSDPQWQHLGPALLGAISAGHISDPLRAYSQMISNFRNDDPSGFNYHLSEFDTCRK